MFSTVAHHGIRVLLPAAVLALLLAAGEARAQARLQTRQNAQCQHNGGQAQPNDRQQLSALQNVSSTPSQLQILAQQQLRAAPTLGRR